MGICSTWWFDRAWGVIYTSDKSTSPGLLLICISVRLYFMHDSESLLGTVISVFLLHQSLHCVIHRTLHSRHGICEIMLRAYLDKNFIALENLIALARLFYVPFSLREISAQHRHLPTRSITLGLLASSSIRRKCNCQGKVEQYYWHLLTVLCEENNATKIKVSVVSMSSNTLD